MEVSQVSSKHEQLQCGIFVASRDDARHVEHILALTSLHARGSANGNFIAQQETNTHGDCRSEDSIGCSERARIP